MTVLMVPSIVGAAVMAGLAIFVYLRRPPPPLWPSLFVVQMASFLFCLGDLTSSHLVVTPAWHLAWLMVEYVGILILPASWWYLALRFSEAQGHPLPLTHRLWVDAPWWVAGVFLVIMGTNPWHGQYLTAHVGTRSDFHWLWWCATLWAYAITMATLVAYARLYRRVKPRPLRAQALIMLLAPCITLVCNAWYVFQSTAPPFDATPLAFAATGGLFVLGIYRTGLFGLLPVALPAITRHDPDGILLVGSDGSLLYANPAAVALLGAEGSRVGGDAFAQLAAIVRPEAPGVARPAAGDLRSAWTAPTQPREGHLYRFGQDVQRWLRVETTPIPMRNQAQGLYSLRLRDVTEFRQATDTVTGQAAVLEAILGSAQDGLLVVDRDGKMLYHNRPFQEMWRIPDDVMETGEDAAALDYVRTQLADPAAFQARVRELYAHPDAVSHDEVLLRDGRVLDRTSHPLVRAGVPGGRVWHFRDVTEQRAAQGIRERQQRLLRGVADATNILLTTEDYTAALDEVVQRLGDAAGVDRVYIMQNDPRPEDGDARYYVGICEWVRDGVARQMGRPEQDRVCLTDLGIHDWFDTLAAGGTINGPIASFTTITNRAFFEQQRIKSVLMAPIIIDGTFWGAIGFDDCEHENTWSENEEAILLTIATSLAGAIQRSHAREALLTSELRYRRLIENAPLGVVALAATGRIVAINPALVKMLGAPNADAILAQNPLEPDSPLDEAIADITRRCLGNGEEGAEEVIASTAWGVHVSLRIHYAPVRDGAGRIVGAQALIEDIAEQMHAREALRDSESRYRQLVENAPLGVIAADRTGQVLTVNQYLVDLLGSPSIEATMAFNLLTLPPLAQAGISGALQRTLDTGDTSTAEYTYVSAWEKELELRVALAPIRDAAGDVTGVQAIVEDVTDQRRAEAALLHSQKLESLGVMAGGIAHDFNNLLVSVLGNASLALMETAPGSDTYEYLGAIEKAAERASDLTEQLLAYAGKGKFIVEPLDLTAMLEDTTQLLEVSISKNVRVDYDLMAGLPAVEGDAAQMRQIIMNLVINASDAIGDGPGVITVRTGTRNIDEAGAAALTHGGALAPGPCVYVEVADTGCGMDADTLANVFDPFFTTKFTGRGLGLAAVVGIVQSHHGGLHVECAPNAGATFTVLLPASSAPVSPSVQRENTNGDWRGTGTVLVVDDDPDVLGVATLILERAGFTVITAADGMEGVETFTARMPDIVAVLLDMTMPRMNGEETFHALRALRADVPVVLSSGYSAQEATDRFAGQDLSGFVQKPYRARTLIATMRAALGAEVPRTA